MLSTLELIGSPFWREEAALEKELPPLVQKRSSPRGDPVPSTVGNRAVLIGWRLWMCLILPLLSFFGVFYAGHTINSNQRLICKLELKVTFPFGYKLGSIVHGVGKKNHVVSKSPISWKLLWKAKLVCPGSWVVECPVVRRTLEIYTSFYYQFILLTLLKMTAYNDSDISLKKKSSKLKKGWWRLLT